MSAMTLRLSSPVLLICVICDFVEESSCSCFPPMWDDSVRWWVFLWRGVDIFSFSLLPLLKAKWRGALQSGPRQPHNVVYKTDQAWLVTDQMCKMTRGKTRERALLKISHLLDHCKEDLSCTGFHMGVVRTNLETCVSSSGAREDSQYKSASMHPQCPQHVCPTPWTNPTHFPSIFRNTDMHSPWILEVSV